MDVLSTIAEVSIGEFTDQRVKHSDEFPDGRPRRQVSIALKTNVI